MFAQSHYQDIAEVIAGMVVSETLPKDHQGKLTSYSIHYFAFLDSLCDMFKRDNPNFKRKVFLAACNAPYFDECLMGIPVINSICRKCFKPFVTSISEEVIPTKCRECRS